MKLRYRNSFVVGVGYAEAVAVPLVVAGRGITVSVKKGSEAKDRRLHDGNRAIA